MAHPLETIQVKTTDPIERIIALVSTRQVKQLVLGLPLRMDGSEGTAAEKIRAFGRELAEKIDLPLYYMDESLTTVAAAEKLHQAGKNAKKQKSIIDQAAAVEILTNWLDQHSPDSFS
jgi:putative Holliday junction resolvase